jgi:hypothetical protein
MENIAMLQLSNGALYEGGTAADFIHYEIETVLPRGTWKTSKHMAEGCFAMQVVDFSDSNFGVGFSWLSILDGKTRWSDYIQMVFQYLCRTGGNRYDGDFVLDQAHGYGCFLWKAGRMSF